ncbi:hypothetical protein GCM10027614_10400 [Micromonospora vulcania]
MLRRAVGGRRPCHPGLDAERGDRSRHAVGTLIGLARANGAPDNIACVVADLVAVGDPDPRHVGFGGGGSAEAA